MLLARKTGVLHQLAVFSGMRDVFRWLLAPVAPVNFSNNILTTDLTRAHPARLDALQCRLTAYAVRSRILCSGFHSQKDFIHSANIARASFFSNPNSSIKNGVAPNIFVAPLSRNLSRYFLCSGFIYFLR